MFQNNENLLPVHLEDEMKRSYLDYAMSVIVSRAIPDVRDGLKPVHRRILYAMYESGYHAGKPYRKSARIVGDVIGKYHPHSDTAIYDALVRMAQSFSLRIPLVDGQGNFGSIDGDAPAAMRYTESRLAKISHNILVDIDLDTVDFAPNYDGSEQEPTILPAMFPNLLVNGAGGIAVGMATNIPPHNLGEVIDACCLYVDNHDIELIELLSVIKGPDFPNGGIILNEDGIQSAYLTGKGSIVTRGRVEIEENNSRQSIIITEIPYMVNKAKLVEKIDELIQEKKIEGIAELRDESNKSGVRVVIDLKKDTEIEVVRNQLYSYTQLQTTFGVIMLALDNGLPKIMNLKEIISSFINFRETVIIRRTIYLLNKARDKAHILLGLRIAVSNIDEVIGIIKSSNDPQQAREHLMSKAWEVADIIGLIKLIDDKTEFQSESACYLTETQAKAILDMRLHRLTTMEQTKLDQDIQELAQEINEHVTILGSRQRLLEILKQELLDIKAEFATPRITTIEKGHSSPDIEELIKREDMVVTVTLGGYIKRVPLDTYRAQKRGGKGRVGLSMRDEDITTQVFVGSTHSTMLFFSNIGQVYSLKLYKLPLSNPQGRGKPIVNVLPLKMGEHITNVMALPRDENEWDNLNIMFATSKGNIRRNDLSDFKKVQISGKIAIRLEQGDSLISVEACKSNDHVLLATKMGKAIRFPIDTVRVFKSRVSDGVHGMKLMPGDTVISMTILQGISSTLEQREAFLSIPLKDRLNIAKGDGICADNYVTSSLNQQQICAMALAEEFILTIAENGFGKRTSAYEYRITNRGGSGIANMDISNKTGRVVAVIPASCADELMLITNNGKLIRCKLESVRVIGRKTSGVILFKMDPGEKVVSVSLIVESNDDINSNDT